MNTLSIIAIVAATLLAIGLFIWAVIAYNNKSISFDTLTKLVRPSAQPTISSSIEPITPMVITRDISPNALGHMPEITLATVLQDTKKTVIVPKKDQVCNKKKATEIIYQARATDMQRGVVTSNRLFRTTDRESADNAKIEALIKSTVNIEEQKS